MIREGVTSILEYNEVCCLHWMNAFTTVRVQVHQIFVSRSNGINHMIAVDNILFIRVVSATPRQLKGKAVSIQNFYIYSAGKSAT